MYRKKITLFLGCAEKAVKVEMSGEDRRHMYLNLSKGEISTLVNWQFNPYQAKTRFQSKL